MGLFGQAWNSKNPKRAVKAVRKMTDETELRRAAKEAKCKEARTAAIDKLINTDQNILAEIARSADMRDVRINPVQKLTDPKLLAEIAKNDNDYDLCIAAVKI